MNTIQFNDKKAISDFSKPYIVAEVNTSHFGSLDIAKKMIDKLKEINCDCVKFQSWTEESLYSKDFYEQNPIAKKFVNKFSFSSNELLTLSKYAGQVGISFASTPYSIKEVDFLLNECNVPYIKIASMDINNIGFLRQIAKKNTSIVLSTGMSEMSEIQTAVQTILDSGNNNLCLLHCVSVYPPKLESVNLRNISTLREAFPSIPIGFSDHTLGTEIAEASVVLGACLIEKHFTLDKSRIGMDNQMALEPDEMSKLIINCNNIHKALGNKERTVGADELEQRIKMRRSAVCTKNLKKGHVLNEGDIDFKRPGNQFAPNEIDKLIGKKLRVDLDTDCLIKKTDLES